MSVFEDKDVTNIHVPDIGVSTLDTIAKKALDVQIAGNAYLRRGSIDSFTLRIAILDLQHHVNELVKFFPKKIDGKPLKVENETIPPKN